MVECPVRAAVLNALNLGGTWGMEGVAGPSSRPMWEVAQHLSDRVANRPLATHRADSLIGERNGGLVRVKRTFCRIRMEIHVMPTDFYCIVSGQLSISAPGVPQPETVRWGATWKPLVVAQCP